MKVLCLLILFLGITVKTFSCTCFFRGDKKSIREKVKKADLIIYATALPDPDIPRFDISVDSTMSLDHTIFMVKEVLKGGALSYIKLGQSYFYYCGGTFRVGESYIIFGFLNDDTKKYETDGCQKVNEWTKRYVDDRINDDDVTEGKEFFKLVKRMSSKKRVR